MEIAQIINLPESTTSDFLEKLRRSKKVKSRLFMWFNKKIRFYIPYDMSWPDYLEWICKNCENWNRFNSSCTFYQDLAMKGYKVDEQRLMKKIHPQLTACKWRIPRTKNPIRTFHSIQEFAEEIYDSIMWWKENDVNDNYLHSPQVPLKAYRCYFCKKPIPQFGWGVLPLIGSSLTSCYYCGSFYKLFFDQTEEKYYVKASKEKFREYSRNYRLFTGEDPDRGYSSVNYGLSLHDFHEEDDLHDETNAFTSFNLFAYYNQLKYLVVRKDEYFNILQEKLAAHYTDMTIILAKEQPVSAKPTKQQIGATRLLQKTGVLSTNYAIELLWNRLAVLNEISDLANKRLLFLAQEKTTELITKIQEMRKDKQLLTSNIWNTIDGQAANYMWAVIKEIIEKQGFEIPNRSRSRHLENDPFKPWGFFQSYSNGNTVINGSFRMISDLYLEKCIEQGFPWKGLEGICHRKTHGGEIGLKLDNEEGPKLGTIPETLRTIVEERIKPEMIFSERLRKRIPVFYIKEQSQAYEELESNYQKISELKIRSVINGKEQETTISKALNYNIISMNRLLEDIVWKEDTIITLEGKKYAPWAIAAENKLNALTREQLTTISSSLREIVNEAGEYFAPFRLRFGSSLEEFDFKH